MRMILYIEVLLLCLIGFGTAQDCILADVPVQANFDEERVIIIVNLFELCLIHSNMNMI